MQEERNYFLKEYRCSCGKLLFKGMLQDGTVEVKCRHCRRFASFLVRDGIQKETYLY